VSGVAIRLLGGFTASLDGRQVPERAWRLKKGRELVKLLALARGHWLHREQAMDFLWRDRAPASAANNLYQAVHAARRALGTDAIEVHDERLWLHADVDADAFEYAAAVARRAGTARAYRFALSLYGGELLPENRYDDWPVQRREELAGIRALLADELAALEPVRELGELPADASSFIGRERELADLHTLMPRTRLLTLTGTGGAGKTRLALEFARRVGGSYAGGVTFVELALISKPALVADAIAGALDVRALPGQPVAEAVADVLAGGESLLVLDSCEHVLGAIAALADMLLRRVPRLRILATTREPLRVTGEVVFRVPSLAIPDPEQPQTSEELGHYESVRLFVERAAAAAPAFELDDETAASVARICSRLDGLPLALELAAARLGALGAGTIAERLDQRFTLLRSASGARPTRQQTLEATLRWSHELLKPDERVLFRRLAVFAGSFDLVAVEAVCSGGSLDRDATVDTLARLVEKSLVTVADRSGECRYRLLETVRLYAGDRLAETAERDVLAMRHARWAVGLAEAKRDSAELDRDAVNLRAALDTLAARDPLEALQLCVAMCPFWLRRIELAEAHRRLVDAVAAASTPSPLRVEALHAAAAVDVRSGMLACAREHAREALTVAVELDDHHVEWRALQFLGTSVGPSRPKESELWFERAHALARRERLAPEEALGVYSLGVARWLLGDVDAAEELVGRSVELFRALAPDDATIPSPTAILNETSSLTVTRGRLRGSRSRRPGSRSFGSGSMPRPASCCLSWRASLARRSRWCSLAA
jgi:predicted ATPase